jgi:hypothetical protein
MSRFHHILPDSSLFMRYCDSRASDFAVEPLACLIVPPFALSGVFSAAPPAPPVPLFPSCRPRISSHRRGAVVRRRTHIRSLESVRNFRKTKFAPSIRLRPLLECPFSSVSYFAAVSNAIPPTFHSQFADTVLSTFSLSTCVSWPTDCFWRRLVKNSFRTTLIFSLLYLWILFVCDFQYD